MTAGTAGNARGDDLSDRGRPEISVGAIVVDDDRLLLIRRGRGPAQGEWSVPGGRVERGETLAGAVVRELYEETALSGFCEQLIGWVERIDEDYHFVIMDFRVRVLDPEPIVAGDDAAEVAWVSFEDLAGYHLVAGLMDFLVDHQVVPGLV